MNLLRVFIFFLIAMSLTEPVISQVVVIPSEKKTVIEGQTYYIHTVKQGETLYSISKAYNVLQEDVVSCNPGVLEGIKAGQELKIPVRAGEEVASERFESTQVIYHIAEKGQTIYSLTQLYRISAEDLYQYNPELEHSSLQAGKVVIIPKNRKEEAQRLEPKPAASYLIHKVARKETLFSISRHYEVDLNRILEMNPEIDARHSNIKTGQEIKIPLQSEVPSIGIPVERETAGVAVIRQNLEEPHTVDLPASDTSVFITDMPVVREDSTGCEQTLQKEFRVAMLLPSYLANNSPASAPDSSMVKDSEGRYKYKDGRYWIHPHSANALEFYEGALLAVDSLKKLGLNVSIHLYDTMHDPEKMQQILNSPVMGTMDLLIGPFYTELINQTSLFAQQNRIYYVSPTSINAASLKNNPYLIQVNSGDINVVNPVVDYIAGQENIHVTLIGNRSESDQSLFQAYCNKLRTVIPDSSLNIHSFRIDSLLQPNRYLKKAKLNAVIIPSNNEAFVNILTTQLNNAAHSHNINLYGLTSWTKFVNIDSEYFHKLELRYAASFYVDYNRPDVQRFLQQFRKYYCTEPTMLTGRGSLSNHAFQYSFLGYDVMFYFASAMARYGKEFGYCIPRFHLPLLQSDFHFIKVDPFSGYINTHLDIFRYTKDYTIVKEDRQAMDD